MKLRGLWVSHIHVYFMKTYSNRSARWAEWSDLQYKASGLT